MANNIPITDIDKVADIAYAKKQRRQKAEDMAKSISPWLHKLYDAYMERGRFPILPYVIGDYYNDPLDKETAIIIAMLVVSMAGTSSATDDIMSLRQLMGQHPYHDFFANREFALLSTGEEQDNRLGHFGSMRYWQIAKVIDHLWYLCDDMGESLGEIFLHETEKGMSPTAVITSMGDIEFVKRADYRLKLLLLALCTDYGIGVGLWHFDGVEDVLDTPMTLEVGNMANILIPNRARDGFNVAEVAKIFGFRPCDLWYLQHAYYELVNANVAECARYMRRWHTQYKNYRCDANNRHQLRLVEPTIFFR